MSFSLASGIITQTGTDTSLDGIELLSGVTRISSNSLSFYILDNLTISVQGTLSIDPEVESMIFINYGNTITFDVKSGGVCNFGREIDIGASVNRFSSGTIALFTRNSDSSYKEGSSDLYVRDGGTLNWYGGTVISKRVFAIYGTLNTFSQNCEYINQHTADIQIRQRSNTTNVQGLVTRGCFLTLINNPVAWNGWKPFDTPDQAISASTSTPDRVWLTLAGFDPSGVAGQQIAFWSDVWIRLINNAIGMSLVAGGNNDGGANSGIYEIRQEVAITTKNLAGENLNAKYFTKDFDNGNRVDTQINNNPTTIPDRIYSGITTDGVAAINTDGGVLIGVIWRDNGSGNRFQNVEYDYRCIANNDSDVFTFLFCEYNYLLQQADYVMKSTTPINVNRVFFIDRSITEISKTIVDAYSTIDNANQFYDRAKSFLFDNFTGESETIVNRSGTLIDAGSNNIVIDATAGPAFAYSGNTITIKAGTYTGDMVTTGTITLANGAEFNGTRTDTNGTITPPVTVTLSGLVANSEVRAYLGTNPTTAVEIDGVENSLSSFTFSHTVPGQSGFIIVHALNYQHQKIPVVFSNTNTTIPVQQILDRQYRND